MYISKLKIKNFKCFDEVEINFDPNFNLIIGENNSGKSTIFEAMRLWQLAFQKFLKDRTNNQQSSFRVFQYFSFTLDEISFLRISDFGNLFKNRSNKHIEIALEVSDGNKKVSLPIIFSSTSKGQVINFELCRQPRLRSEVSEKLSEIVKKPLGSDFKDIFLFTYINPIFHLPSNEPQFSKGYILNKLHEAKANEIIRNLIFSISPEKKRIRTEIKKEKLIQVEAFLKQILQLKDISFSKRLEDEESFIKIFAKNSVDNLEVEINQLGSGTINVLNILSVLAYGDYENFKLNSLLLDEPDSHLHFNHQSRLYKHLEKVSIEENKQIFIITHNSSLISQFDNVLFIKNNEKEIKPISLEDYLDNNLKDIDENHYSVIKSLNESKKEKDDLQIQLNKVENFDIPLLYTEGPSDKIIIENAFNKLYNIPLPFNIINGTCANHLKNIFENKDTFEKNPNQQQIALFDFDDAYNQWNGVKGYTIFENDPYKCLCKKSNLHYGYILLLPVPRIEKIIKQVIIKDFENYKHNSVLSIEHLFFDIKPFSEGYFNEVLSPGGGSIYKFKGDSFKMEFANKTSNLFKEDFKNFIPLFEKIAELINFELPKADA